MERLPKTPPSWLWRWTAGAISLFWVSQILVNVITSLSQILLIILVSFFVACAFEQPVSWLERRGIRRGLSTLIVLLGSLIGTVAVAAAGGAVALGQLRSLRESLPGLIGSLAMTLDHLGIQTDTADLADKISLSVQTLLSSNAGDIILRSGVVIGQLAAGALAVFYLVADGPRLRRNVCTALPAHRQEQVLVVWTSTIEKAGGYFIVRGILAAAATLFSWMFFSVIGLPYAIALAIWVGVISQAIPAVGTYLAGVLPILVAAGDSGKQVLAVLVFLVVYQQIENYFFSPRISRKVLSVHPALAFFSAIAGGILAGAPGALIAVPMVATIEAMISSTVERHQLIENELLNDPARIQKQTRRKRNRINPKIW